MAKKRFVVVQVPTPKGVVYGHAALILGEYERLADADMKAYLEWVDEPAPDKEDYYKITVVDREGTS